MSQPMISSELVDENDRLFKEFMKSEQQQLEKQHNKKTYECSICYDELTIKDFYIMDECNHKFCIDCLHGHYRSQVRSRFPDIKCPQNLCKYKVSYQEVKHILKGEDFELYDKILFENTMAKNKNVRYCPSCGTMAIANEDNCYCPDPNCGYEYCFQCRNAQHHGLTCQENDELERELANELEDIEPTIIPQNPRVATLAMFRPIFKNRRWKKNAEISPKTRDWILANTTECPYCFSVIEKSMGCNRMVCHCAWDIVGVF
ncbi:hypothetical protein DLAC_10027 [Tieghemostelium lacteum]|uniref:RBR-type E3 ubiquitin transferase n=1 Tax=Tieghemostelium lacteum TaxID=361077 RepID=A0A151Z6E3_TIELA|nr:hypothetical protein DLAC_10027 [Tieghemostelium lacteum]|eukprot:KYQ89364.1 hypothetical protein DLAC_10027 [Tieghemostelium lacteum]